MNKRGTKTGPSERISEILEVISRDRTRTNLLRKQEQRAIAWLVQRIPERITSNMLSGLGFFGSIVVCAGFMLAAFFDSAFLLLGPLGFTISWFGDSLDGRLAYYRNKPRKNYGFVLDITLDWTGIILIGCGFMIYAEGFWELLGYGFVVMYGWEMIIVLMRYKITNQYSIDSGKFSPTEARILISLILILEVLLPGSISYSTLIAVLALFAINVADTGKLLRIADTADKNEKK
ncbi:MAG: CDP-alcohol phosphatidyltransferase family protein [Bacteroidales bacterium]